MKILEILLVSAAVFSRLIPHAPNFTAIGAVALFAGYLFKTRREALAVALASMLISDFIIGFHSTIIWVYGAFALIALLGRTLTKFSWFKALGLNIGAAALFFVVTNFGVWVSTSLYPHTIEGLSLCFVAAIPFFGNTLSSQMIFGIVLFAAHQSLAQLRSPNAKKIVA